MAGDADRIGSRERGFALPFVIWTVGLISLIVIAVMISERYRTLAAGNTLENAKAEALAEAGANLLALKLSAAKANSAGAGVFNGNNGRPILCRMPPGGIAALAIEDEGGKVDLNAASPRLLSALLRGLSLDPAAADRLATEIAAFSRQPGNEVLGDVRFQAYAGEGRRFGPKQAPMESAMELDQVLGMTSNIARAALPYVTVHSRSPGIDPNVAAPELLALLAGDDRVNLAGPPSAGFGQGGRGIPSEFISVSTGRSYMLRAEIRTPANGWSSREAIVEVTAGPSPLAYREWRQGVARYGALLEAAGKQPDNLPPC